MLKHSKKRKKYRVNPGQDVSLNITSMADIFTILLVFLLKSIASGAMDIQPSSGLILPNAFASTSTGTEALKIEISETGVQVEGQPVATLDHFKFNPSEILSDGSSKLLNETLSKERKRQTLIAQSNTDVKPDARVIVISDQRVPYQTLKNVLASAALNGYSDFKLAVIKSGE